MRSIDGLTWLSIFQNKPTTEETYDGTVEITGDIVGSCKYEDGQYCGATGCNKDGCTVSHLPTLRVHSSC
jgi:SUN family beta-glucosidase